MQLSFRVKEYLKPNGVCPFREWLEGIDRTVAARIQARIFRFELGNLGDSKSIGQGIYEARFDFGSGYRLYFGKDERTVIVLLCGGDKATQGTDIRRARKFWMDYLESRNVTS